jgi:ABC-type sugar transport system ATPase subunit
LDEPTRGVDVGAKEEIHRSLRDLAAAGAAVIVSSAEGSELIDVCDRIAVMAHGRIVAWLSPDEATEATLTSHAAA